MAHRLGSDEDTDRHTSAEPDPSSGEVGVGRRVYVKLGLAGIMATLLGSGGAAAAGGPHRPDGDGDGTRLVIRPHSGVTRYEITVDGRIQPGANTALDADARISGSSAEGIVRDEDRRYRFDGELRDLAIDGDAGVYIESERIDAA